MTIYEQQKYKSEWQVQSQLIGALNGLPIIHRYILPIGITDINRESLFHKLVQGNLPRSYRRVIYPLQPNRTVIHGSIPRSLLQLLLRPWRERIPLVNMDDYSLKL